MAHMRAEIICVGTELLLGHIVNTNAPFLSQKLAALGVDVYYHITVGDNPMRLGEAIRFASERSDIIITTGGLGPTVDDITIKTIMGLTKEEVPQWIKNDVGSAPGFITEYEGKMLIALPGPPRELEPMFDNRIAPYLRKKFSLKSTIWSRTIKLTGLPESKVDNKVKDLLQLEPPTTVGIYAKLGEVDLKIMTKTESRKAANRDIKTIENKIRSRLKEYIFGYDDETLEDAVGALLIMKKKKIAVAESCTGGLISHRLTNVSGSSKYFIRGAIPYANEVKVKYVGVSEESLKRYGAVSRQVALEMARGIRTLMKVDIGLSVTGIAGPTGGTKKKPVGLVYIALSLGKKNIVKEFRFKGSREEIKFRTSQAALDLVRRECAHS